MKRGIFFLTAVLFFTFSFIVNLSAQDDQYYDPKKDPAKQNNTQSADNLPVTESNTQQGEVDRTDGYGNPADKYDPRDNYNSNSYNSDVYATDAGYYDDDYETYFYSNRLNRYYRPNYGVNYYSYWYTPAYYNSWGTTYVVSYNPWYRDPWWRWNRGYRTTTVIVYDPFWDWNFGWNTCAYYNSWSNPYWGYNSCNYYGGYSSWGYNGWGYNNGGFCGGYYNNFNNGYWNGYNNGYWNGYNDGWNSAYAYGGGYGGYYFPHHRQGDGSSQQNNNRIPVTATSNPTNPPVDKPRANGEIHRTDIPKEGITKPFTPNTNPNIGSGIKVEANTEKPYVNHNGTIGNATKPSVNVKPNEGNIGINNNPVNRWDSKEEKVNTYNGGVIQPKSNVDKTGESTTGKYSEPKSNTKPFVQQNSEPEGWHNAPPDRWSNKPNVQQPAQQQPQQQPRQNDWNKKEQAQPRGNYSEPQKSNPVPQYYPQPRNENNNINRVEPRSEPRNRVEPRNEQPRMNVQPRQENFNRVEPRSNPTQRGFTPSQSPQHGGGNLKRH